MSVIYLLYDDILLTLFFLKDGNVHVPYVAMTTSHPEHHGIDSQSGRRGENLVVGSAPVPASAFIHAREPEEEAEEEEAAGHDSPNWSKGKSFTILFGCTLLYSIVAEILVDTVDEVMKNLAVDEKFLGLTLFALVSSYYTIVIYLYDV